MFKGKYSNKRVVFSIMLLVVVVLFAVSSESCKKKAESKMDPVLEKIKAAGEVVVGTSADYPPFEFYLMNDKEEDIVGIDIDIANSIANELGVKLVVKDIVFSQLFKALDEEKVHFVVAGLTPTDSRKVKADFSTIYYQAIQNILIRAEDKESIRSLEDLRGKKVGTQKDSIQDEIIRSKVQGAAFINMDRVLDLIKELKDGAIDAVILEKPVAESFVQRHPELTNIDLSEKETTLGSAIAVKKGNSGLLEYINQQLAKLKEAGKITQFVEQAKIQANKIKP